MHYISGTRFSIVPSRGGLTLRERGNTLRDRLLPSNLSYILTHIQKTETGVVYSFAGSDGKQHTATFASCREADAFIAKHRNETIPNYDAPKESSASDF